ncbi:MAG: hypothetical protein ACRDCT_09330, partial [Shewanella sp.]
LSIEGCDKDHFVARNGHKMAIINTCNINDISHRISFLNSDNIAKANQTHKPSLSEFTIYEKNDDYIILKHPSTNSPSLCQKL